MGVALVQTASSTFGVAGSGTCAATFAAPPTNGNLLVAICMLYDANGAPSATAGWTLRDSVHSVAGVCYAALFSKYAGAGESATQNPDGNGRQIWSCSIYEVSGVSGVWATDFVADHLNALAGGTAAGGTTTGTVTGFNTTDPNSLVLGSFSCWGGTASAPINDSGVTPAVTDQTTATGANAGVFGTFSTVNTASFGAISASGTAIGGTFTVANSSFALQYGIVELQPTITAATGAVGTITLSTPAGAANASALATGAVGTITTVAPTGSPSLGAQISVPKFLAQAAVAIPDSIESSKMLAQAAIGIDNVIESPKILSQAGTGVTDATGGMVDGAIAAPKIVAYAALGPPPPRRPAQVRVQWNR